MKILSIDLDILMKDCLSYQGYIDEELTPLQSWQVIKWKSGKSFYPICEDTLKFIKEILYKKCRKSSAYIIDEHDEIVKILSELPEKNNHVTNLDFHHDITYGNGDEELNIENWVQHARKHGYLLDYFWINRDDSEVVPFCPFNYLRSSWKDVNIDQLPEYDVVVFCISHQFTHPCHWELAQELKEYLHNEVQGKFTLCSDPEVQEEEISTYSSPELLPETAFQTYFMKYFNYYIEIQKIDDIVWFGIFKTGNDSRNILSASKKVLDDIIEKYDIGFCWVEGYKSECYIRRLAKNYTVKSEYFDEFNRHNLILTKKEKVVEDKVKATKQTKYPKGKKIKGTLKEGK